MRLKISLSLSWSVVVHQVGEADTLLRRAHQCTRLARGAAIALVS